MSEIIQKIKNYLRERETLIPRPKLVDFFEGNIFGQTLPPGVTPEQAIEVVARSEWARKLAEGVCGPKYVGYTPGTPEFETCVHNVSHKVAARVLGLSWPPAPAVPTPTRRRRTR